MNFRHPAGCRANPLLRSRAAVTLELSETPLDVFFVGQPTAECDDPVKKAHAGELGAHVPAEPNRTA